MSRFWLVELSPGYGLRWCEGVEHVTDLRKITFETLCTILMRDAEFGQALGAVRKRGRAKHLEEAYRTWTWQPRLPEVN